MPAAIDQAVPTECVECGSNDLVHHVVGGWLVADCKRCRARMFYGAPHWRQQAEALGRRLADALLEDDSRDWKAFQGYKPNPRGGFMAKVCPECPDAQEVRDWAKAKGMDCQEAPCPAHYQARLRARIGEAKLGLGRYRIDYDALDEEEKEYTGHGWMLVSRNTKPGQKPYRITLFDATMETLVHFDLGEDELDPEGWSKDWDEMDPLLRDLQDYIDPDMQGYTLVPVASGPPG